MTTPATPQGQGERLRDLVTRLAQALRSVRDLQRQYGRLVQLLDRTAVPPREVERAAQRARQMLDRLRAHLDAGLLTQLADGLVAVEQRLPELQVRWKMAWLHELERALQTSGLELRVEGEALYVDVLRLQPQWSQGRVQIYFGPDRLDTVSAEPARVARWLRQWRQQLQRMLTPPDVFPDLLWQAYHRVTQRQHGARALLSEVYRELVWMKQPRAFWVDARPGNFRPYPRYAFSLDLARLRATPAAGQHRFEVRLLTATFDATRRRADYLWIPEGGPGRGARYSWLEMRPRSGSV